MSAQVTINSLPAAGPITGTEAVPIVQNGVTVQTTTGAISASPSQNQTFLTLNQEATLPNSRYLSTTNGLSLTDGGPQSFYRLGLGGAAGSLQTASNGLVVKDSGNTVVARQIAVSGSGLSVSNADGTSGDPTLQLTGIAAAIASLSGTGMLALTAGGTSVAGRNLLGTANQIDVVNGNGALGNPTVSIADDAVFPGTGAITVPIGTAAQQPLGSDGKIRYNSDLSLFEGYANGSWRVFGLSGGVLSFSGGSTGLTPAVATPGIVTLGGILNVASGGTGVTTSTGTGSVVLNNSPTFITPALGTPSSGVATNLTGLPLSTGVTGTLPVANGGTGLTSYTANGVVYASGTGTLATGSALTFNGTNLGVGTVSPQNKLTISGPAQNLSILNTTPGSVVTPSFSGIKFYGYTEDQNGWIAGVEAGNTASSNYQGLLRFLTKSNLINTDPAERMRIDSSGNVGIGTTTFTYSAVNRVAFEVNGLTDSVIAVKAGNTASAYLQGASTQATLSSVGSIPLLFGTNNTERARIDPTGNLLVGTTTNTNTSKIVSAGTISETVGTTQYLVASQYDIGTAPNQIPLNQYLGGLAYEDAANIAGQVGVIAGTAALPSLVSATDTDTGVWFPAANTLAMSTGGAERMRVDSSGNLGLGVVPSAWISGERALQVGDLASLTSRSVGSGNRQVSLYNNAYVSAGEVFRYLVSDAASFYRQNAGYHFWLTAPSGTAGNAISFTTAMTLDASGNLGVGTTSPLTRLNVVDSSTNTFAGAFRGSGGTNIVALGTTSGGASIAGYTASFAATADLIVNPSGGNLGLGVTPSAWSGFKAFEFGAGNALMSSSSGYGQLYLMNNAYYNGSAYIYKNTQSAAMYVQNQGAHQWFNAPSGTAGAAISFTQAMTLDASGNLGVGTTSPASRLHASGLGTTAIARVINTDAFTGGNNFTLPHLFLSSGNDVTGNVTRFAMTVGTGAQVFLDALMENGSTVYSSLLFRTRGADVMGERLRITSAGNQIASQPAESAQNANATLTVANLQTRIVTSNSAVTLTLPTGTDFEGYAGSMATNTAFECTFIATTANAITIAANGNTTVGSLTVAGNTSGIFRFRKTATNTFTVYRVA